MSAKFSWTSTRFTSKTSLNVEASSQTKKYWRQVKRISSTSWKILRSAQMSWTSRQPTRFLLMTSVKWRFTHLQALTFLLKWWIKKVKWHSCSSWTNLRAILASVSLSFASSTFSLNAQLVLFLTHTLGKTVPRPLLSWPKWFAYYLSAWSYHTDSAR